MAKKKQDTAETGTAPDLFGDGADNGAEKAAKFEERLERLEEIVAAMERGGLTLAESLTLYEEGAKHLKELTATLGTVRGQVMKLVAGADGDAELEDYTGEDTP